MDEGELKPCPFCGGTETVTMARAHAIKGRKYVECVTCTAIGPDADTMEEAVEAWNRRVMVPSAPVRELVAAVREYSGYVRELMAGDAEAIENKEFALGWFGKWVALRSHIERTGGDMNAALAAVEEALKG